jgi:hypothetical protein
MRDVYWLFVYLQKAFDTVVREALWRKQGKKGTSAKFTEGLNEMYKDVKIGVKWGGNYIL